MAEPEDKPVDTTAGPDAGGGRERPAESPNVPRRKSSWPLAAAAIAAGHEVKSAARLAGVSRKTVSRWQARDWFLERVEQIRGEAVRRAQGRLSDSMVTAAETLRKLMRDEDASIRYRASSKLIELGIRLRETLDLEDRVQTLEQILQAGGQLPGTTDQGGQG